jgi:hypothetical protein
METSSIPSNPLTWTPYLASACVEGFDGEEHDEETIVSAWQYLINTGLAWQLQGWYGRTAQDLLDNGICEYPY